MREDTEYADVTLVCEDGYQVDAHKIILAASSPLLKSLLSMNKHSHPLIFMRGMKSTDLTAIVDFLYYGEANIYEENLDTFLAIAEEFKLTGLTGVEGDTKLDSENASKPYETKVTKNKIHAKKSVTSLQDESSNSIQNDSKYEQISNERAISVTFNFLDLDEKVSKMMVKGQNMIHNGQKGLILSTQCLECGKEGVRTQIRDHIEANHVQGLSIPCDVCGKTSRSRSALRMHKSSYHKVMNHILGPETV